MKKILEQHQLWIYTNGKQGIRADLEGANLEYADLYGSNLERANLERANLKDAYLVDANLTGAILRGAILTGANLRGAILTGAYLWGANLEGANLYHANLEGADLYHANLVGANLTGANLYHADLRGANLYHADLTGANLTGANLTNTIIEMRADKVNKAKIDARDIVIEVIRLVTLELSNNRPSNTLLKRTDDCDEDIGSENLETISQILDLMGVKFSALTANRRAITFEYKKLNSL